MTRVSCDTRSGHFIASDFVEGGISTGHGSTLDLDTTDECLGAVKLWTKAGRLTQSWRTGDGVCSLCAAVLSKEELVPGQCKEKWVGISKEEAGGVILCQASDSGQGIS